MKMTPTPDAVATSDPDATSDDSPRRSYATGHATPAPAPANPLNRSGSLSWKASSLISYAARHLSPFQADGSLLPDPRASACDHTSPTPLLSRPSGGNAPKVIGVRRSL
jgi:hypothetical protein